MPQTLFWMCNGMMPTSSMARRVASCTSGSRCASSAVARARAAVADGGGELGAVLWFQGESDTIEVDDARSYGGKMERLVADLRADLGLPNLLVIQVRTNAFPLDHTPCDLFAGVN